MKYFLRTLLIGIAIIIFLFVIDALAHNPNAPEYYYADNGGGTIVKQSSNVTDANGYIVLAGAVVSFAVFVALPRIFDGKYSSCVAMPQNQRYLHRNYEGLCLKIPLYSFSF